MVRTKVIWVKLGKEARPEMGFQARYSSRGGDVVVNDRQLSNSIGMGVD